MVSQASQPRVGVLSETTELEKRVSLVPETVRSLADAGLAVTVARGAGAAAGFDDESYADAGASLANNDAVYRDADVIVCVTPFSPESAERLPDGCTVAGFLDPVGQPEAAAVFARKNVTALAFEQMPRTTRAQAMDALSSQRSVIGYVSVLMGAGLLPRFIPMLTTPAGTIRPASIFVIGTGVAGLQAIATAKRLGAIVLATDVRAVAKEQVESLGARFVFPDIEADASGGYARELTEDEKKKQQELLAKSIADSDVVITTALIPGRPAPKIVDEGMVRTMKPGSVIVDAAADGGGNCALSNPGATETRHGVTVHAPLNVPSRLPTHSSVMYSRNLHNLLKLMLDDEGRLAPDWEDEILQGARLARDGADDQARGQ